MDWLIYERSNGQPVSLVEDSHADEMVAMIARSVVTEGVSDFSIILLDCNRYHPRADCPCIACEVARGNQTVILIGSA